MVRVLAYAVTMTAIVMLFVGCGERNSPIQPEPYYRLITEIQTPGWAKDVTVLDNIAYVADNQSGIALFNIQDALNPEYIETWQTMFPVKQIKAAPLNGLIIVFEDEQGVATNDAMRIYSPETGAIVGEMFDSGLWEFHFVEAVDTIWIVESDEGEGFRGNFVRRYGDVWLADEEIPAVPAPIGRMKGMDFEAGLDDTLAFLCLDERGIMSISVDLMALTTDSLGWVETPGSAYDVDYSDGYLYVADYFGGLVVIDATDPGQMVQVAQVVPEGASRCEKVIAEGYMAVVMDSYDGMYVFDVSVPASPVLLDIIELPEPTGMKFYNGWLLITDEARGLLIFQP
jgi:hypothetical protein